MKIQWLAFAFVIALFIALLGVDSDQAFAFAQKPTSTPTTGSGPPTNTPRPTREPSNTPKPTNTLPIIIVPTATPTPGIGVLQSPTSTSVEGVLLPSETPVEGVLLASETPLDLQVELPDQGITPPPPIYGIASLTPTPGDFQILPSGVDLEVTGMEITQGMQNLANQMPVVEDRWTTVRVYVRTDSAILGDVKGLLIAIKNGVEYGPIPANNQTIVATESGGERINIDDSLYFDIPLDWTAEGETTFVVLVYSGIPGTVFNLEPDASNNLFFDTVDFQESTSYTVKFVNLHNHLFPFGEKGAADDFFYLPGNAGPKVKNSIYRYLPISYLDYQANYTYLAPNNHNGFDEFVPHYNDWDLSSCFSLLNWDAEVLRLSSLLDQENAENVQYYGMLSGNQDVTIGCNPGFGGASGYGVAIGQMTYSPWGSSPWFFGAGSLLAHELLHSMDVSAHIPCSDAEITGGAIDENYPYLDPCSIAFVDDEGYYGLDGSWAYFSPDLVGPTVISNDPAESEPNLAFPTMSYSGPQWTSALNWCRILDILGVACDPPSIGIVGVELAFPDVGMDAFQFEGADEHLLAIGLIDLQANSAFVHELRRTTQPSPNAINTATRNLARLQDGAGSEYHLVLLDENEDTLFRRDLVDSSTSHVEEAPTTLAFYDLIPWVEGTRFIRICTQDDEVIFEREVSDNAPTVTLLSPNGGEIFNSGPMEIFWEAEDADGDELTYFIQYSPDNGQTWVSIAAGLQNVSGVKLDELRNLAGSTQAIIRVTAIDGVHSTSDQSDAVFSMPDQPPQVEIFSPAYYAQFATNALVRMQASVQDLEDGRIAGDFLTWESDLDGPLGTSEYLDSYTLSPGIHIITLRAEDSAGNRGESSVEIFIDPNVVRELVSEEELAQGLAVLRGEVPDLEDLADDASQEEAAAEDGGFNTLLILAVAALLLVALVFGLARARRNN